MVTFPVTILNKQYRNNTGNRSEGIKTAEIRFNRQSLTVKLKEEGIP